MKAVLTFLGLLDEQGQLSRTNLAVWIALAGMVQSLVRHSTIDYGPLAAFIVALVSYQAKRALLQSAVTNETSAAILQAQADLAQHKAEVKANVEQLIAAHTVIAAKVQSQANVVVALQKARGM